MRYYLDTEFDDNGRTIELISIALVAEDGRELYLVSSEFDENQCNSWVAQHVLPKLPKDTDEAPWLLRQHIARLVISFIGGDPSPEFWAYFAAYDWVVFCQLFGPMADLPAGYPMYCNDLKQLATHLDIRDTLKTLIPMPVGEHDALEDARWNKLAHEYLMNRWAKRMGCV